MGFDSVPDDPIEAIRAAPISEAPGSPLRIPHFRNLWLGSTVSLLGDQFYIVALPWLVLQVTGSSLALGVIMMSAAVLRAFLMLMGGAVSDRIAPRNFLLVTNFARMLLVAAIAVLTWTHWIQVRHLYFLAFAFGIADAFGLPAGQALLPTLFARDQLTSYSSYWVFTFLPVSFIAGPVLRMRWIRSETLWTFCTRT
jgi:MFS family permease